MSAFIVTEKAMRPASSRRECFYCRQAIGAHHKPDCVLISRKAKVRAIIEYEVEVPAHWGKDDVEFHRNEGSWCANNMLRELDELCGTGGCLCPITEFEFIESVGDPYLSKD